MNSIENVKHRHNKNSVSFVRKSAREGRFLRYNLDRNLQFGNNRVLVKTIFRLKQKL
jgi:hypothetical protein